MKAGTLIWRWVRYTVLLRYKGLLTLLFPANLSARFLFVYCISYVMYVLL